MSDQVPLRDTKGRWLKGQTGNAGGRAKGAGWHQSMRLKLRDSVEPVLEVLREAALHGDMKAASLLLERVLPALRPGDDPVEMPIAGATLAEQAKQIMQYVAGGSVTPSQGAELMHALGQVSRIREVDELLRRIEALEQRGGN